MVDCISIIEYLEKVIVNMKIYNSNEFVDIDHKAIIINI